MKYDKSLLDLCFKAARDNDSGGRFRLSSILAYRGKPLSFGFNSYEKTHPFQKKYAWMEHKCFWHSETNAIFNALKNGVSEDIISKCFLYVARAKKTLDSEKNIYALAKPCKGCLTCIKDYGIKRIVYTNDHENGSSYSVLEMEN